MKLATLIASLGLTLTSISFAHEGHEHDGLSKEETAKQVKEGKLCILNDRGNSEGAVVEKDGRMYRCVKAYGKNLEMKPELVWVELKLEGNALSTLP
ncbi:MAG TPA: hypothetical protein DIW64_04445 [Cellvibrio sp.]|uniref:DUF1496 domain-containing protein n=1 Tax=Cellvibrio sp. TaxID=1965322 RepID=UPI000EB8A865|nr:DUF1496 domain-containing protein [Cellvibrio sp.]HCS63376.1 hypothetical protein [Cellvibrio sp.]